MGIVMKTRVFFFLAAMGLLAGCAKELQAPVENGNLSEKFVLTVGISNPEAEVQPAAASTRTSLGALVGSSHKVYWSNGDKIRVNGVESDALADLAANTEMAGFSFGSILSTPYNVLYPSSIYDDATHVTLPAVQTYKAGGFADGVFPMAGYSADGSNLSVSHLCAIVKVSVLRAAADADEDKLVSVRFKGRNNEQVSGSFAIDYQYATLAGASAAAADKVVKVVKSLATATDAAAVYYVVVPAGTYSNGFDIIVQDANGHIMTKTKASSQTLAAGHLYSMPEFAFVPTGTELGIEISNAAQLIKFAEDYNKKVYDGLGDEPLIATLTADIVFDDVSSDSFNETHGIGLKEGINVEAGDPAGSNDYYFNGVFNGNNHKISGLEATVPLFVATGSAAHIQNLTLDNTCSFTFTHPNSVEGMFGSIAGYHKGELDHVAVAADVALDGVASVTYYTTLGGLVGRATTGTVRNSEYSGLISTPDSFTGTNKLIIGGLVGRFSNSGSITGSYFKGAISNSAQITSSDKTNPYIIIGGVAGHVDGGASISSTNTTADHADEASAYSGFNGKIVNKTTVAYNSAVGGIVGELNNGTVSSCTNAATIALSIYKEGSDGSRYMRTGGIVGKNNADGTVTGCTNNGSVEHRSNPRLQAIGGIVGWNAGEVSSCTNNAAVNQMTSGQSVKAGRVVSLGGVIGENNAGASVSDIHNTANIQISSMEDGTASDARMGGVIAYNLEAIDGGNTKNITNTGQVYFSPNFTSQFLGYELGGIVGLSLASVENAHNSGYVYFRWNSDANVASKVYLGGVVGKMDGNGTIGGCVNEGGASNAGEVYLFVKASTTAGHNNIFAGGILGYTESDVTISDCSNSGYIHGGNTSRVNGTSCYAGGIVAYLKGASSILDCTNTGNVDNVHNNNNDTIGSTPLSGGIAGHVEGTDSDPITIGGTTGCSVDATVSSTRGWVAGIAAYAKYVNLSNCSVEQDIICAARAIGGLVGKAEYCSITNSSFNGANLKANNVQVGTGEGGIVGNMNNTTVDGCSCYATSLTNNVSIAAVGTIVGVSGENNTIQNCHYKPTITTTAGSGQTAQIAGSGTFTDGGNNVADL